MTLESFLSEATQTLTQSGIPTARLDVLVLLEDATGRDRAYLLAHPETELTAAQARLLTQQIKQRARHVPLAYIRGNSEFYGREFMINNYVLEPRPESETMIELLKDIVQVTGFTNGKGLTIIDVGTGSGALAITAKLELPMAEVMAIDIDPDCLVLTRKNAASLGADITATEGDLLSPIAANQPAAYALLCNLPYVPDGFHINKAATHEPRLAIFGGPDGLDLYRALFAQISRLRIKPRIVLTEALPPQHEVVAEIAAGHGYRQKTRDDFIQVFIPG